MLTTNHTLFKTHLLAPSCGGIEMNRIYFSFISAVAIALAMPANATSINTNSLMFRPEISRVHTTSAHGSAQQTYSTRLHFAVKGGTA
jgi:hypothetical protein